VSLIVCCTTLLSIAKGSLLVKVSQDDHASGRRVCTPYGCESVPLDSHHNHQDGKVGRTKSHHHPDLGEEECTTGDD